MKIFETKINLKFGIEFIQKNKLNLGVDLIPKNRVKVLDVLIYLSVSKLFKIIFSLYSELYSIYKKELQVSFQNIS